MNDLFNPSVSVDGLPSSPQEDRAEANVDARPLAERLRPNSLDDVVGQDHLLLTDQSLGRQIALGSIGSTLFWGPPGCGKTTIARLLAQACDMRFVAISAIFSGVAELKKTFDAAKIALSNGKRTLLFVDEIHRFNRAQQDSFLPVVEDGTIILVGATTENPSFELNAALLSRMQVLVLKRLDDAAMEVLIERTLNKLPINMQLSSGAKNMLMAMADGDGRYLLTMLEQLLRFEQNSTAELPDGQNQQKKKQQKQIEINEQQISALLSARAVQYDKSQDAHYNLISALHKSLRGSDVDAALYWYNRMIAGGEDPRYIARRLARFASEDVGMADPQALVQVLSSWQVYERLGSPEGDLALTQAVIYLATAPKSDGLYAAHRKAAQAASANGSLQPPKHIMNAPTGLMKELGYMEGYIYDHSTDEGFSGQNYFPDSMNRQKFYDPPNRGFERDIRKRLDYWHSLREKKAATNQ